MKKFALILTGWYLMTPQAHLVDGRYVFDDRAPLAEWRQVGAFDTAKECEAMIGKIRASSVKFAVPTGAEYNRCVASDDKRLQPR
jgi:hypothetical protein